MGGVGLRCSSCGQERRADPRSRGRRCAIREERRYGGWRPAPIPCGHCTSLGTSGVCSVAAALPVRVQFVLVVRWKRRPSLLFRRVRRRSRRRHRDGEARRRPRPPCCSRSWPLLLFVSQPRHHSLVGQVQVSRAPAGRPWVRTGPLGTAKEICLWKHPFALCPLAFCPTFLPLA